MLYRGLSVTLAMLFVYPVTATESDIATESEIKSDKDSLSLVAEAGVVYEPWPETAPLQMKKPVVPPPPGPYISTALSDLPPSFSGSVDPTTNTTTEGDDVGGTQTPSVKPNVQWSSKLPQPEIWKPESGIRYAPPMSQTLPDVSRPPVFMYQPMPPMRYNNPGYGAGYGRPNYAYPPAHIMPPRFNSRQYGQPRPMWNNFEMPMSNYRSSWQQQQPPQQQQQQQQQQQPKAGEQAQPPALP